MHTQAPDFPHPGERAAELVPSAAALYQSVLLPRLTSCPQQLRSRAETCPQEYSVLRQSKCYIHKEI